MTQEKKLIGKNHLFIQQLTHKIIKELPKNNKLFCEFLKLNKGFINKAVLSVIGRNKQHPNYEDFFQVGCIGLLKALNKFNKSRASFSTFAFTVIQNDIRQEIKKLNRQKNISKNELGQYVYREISIESLLKKTNGQNQIAEYHESLFKETSKINKMRDFEDEILTKIIIENKTQYWSLLEKEIYQLKYVEKLTLNEVAVELKKKHKKKSLSFATIRNIFYKELKPKIFNICEELI